VLGTAGTRDHERLVGYGADAVADYRGDRVGVLREQLPGGADAVLDLVGGAVAEQAFALLADGGRLVTAVLGHADLVAPRGITWSFQGTQAEPDRLAEIGRLVASGALAVEIGARYALHDAGGALRAVAGRAVPGKALVDIGWRAPGPGDRRARLRRPVRPARGCPCRSPDG
jgi:NADPH2:quinone reductase